MTHVHGAIIYRILTELVLPLVLPCLRWCFCTPVGAPVPPLVIPCLPCVPLVLPCPRWGSRAPGRGHGSTKEAWVRDRGGTTRGWRQREHKGCRRTWGEQNSPHQFTSATCKSTRGGLGATQVPEVGRGGTRGKRQLTTPAICESTRGGGWAVILQWLLPTPPRPRDRVPISLHNN